MEENANRILFYLIQHCGEDIVVKQIFEKMKFTNRVDSIYQTYNELQQKHQFEQIEPESPTDCVKLELNSKSFNYTSTNINKFSYSQLYQFLSRYYKTNLYDEQLNTVLIDKLNDSAMVPQLIMALLTKKFNKTTFECILKYQHLIKSQVICRKVFLNYQSQYNKYLTCLMLYYNIYEKNKNVFIKNQMLYHLLLFSSNVDAQVQSLCFKVLNNFKQLDQTQFESFIYLFKCVKSHQVLQLCSQYLITLLNSDFNGLILPLFGLLTKFKFSHLQLFYIYTSILLVQENEQVDNTIYDRLTIIVQDKILVLTSTFNEDISENTEELSQTNIIKQFINDNDTQIKCNNLILLLFLLTRICPDNYNSIDAIILSCHPVIQLFNEEQKQLVLYFLVHAMCPQINQTHITIAKYSFESILQQRNLIIFQNDCANEENDNQTILTQDIYYQYYKYDTTKVNLYGTNISVISTTLNFLIKENNIQLIQSFCNLLNHKLLHKQAFYEQYINNLTLQLIDCNFLQHIYIFLQFYKKYSKFMKSLVDYLIKKHQLYEHVQFYLARELNNLDGSKYNANVLKFADDIQSCQQINKYDLSNINQNSDSTQQQRQIFSFLTLFQINNQKQVLIQFSNGTINIIYEAKQNILTFGIRGIEPLNININNFSTTNNIINNNQFIFGFDIISNISSNNINEQFVKLFINNFEVYTFDTIIYDLNSVIDISFNNSLVPKIQSQKQSSTQSNNSVKQNTNILTEFNSNYFYLLNDNSIQNINNDYIKLYKTLVNNDIINQTINNEYYFKIYFNLFYIDNQIEEQTQNHKLIQLYIFILQNQLTTCKSQKLSKLAFDLSCVCSQNENVYEYFKEYLKQNMTTKADQQQFKNLIQNQQQTCITFIIYSAILKNSFRYFSKSLQQDELVHLLIYYLEFFEQLTKYPQIFQYTLFGQCSSVYSDAMKQKANQTNVQLIQNYANLVLYYTLIVSNISDSVTDTCVALFNNTLTNTQQQQLLNYQYINNQNLNIKFIHDYYNQNCNVDQLFQSPQNLLQLFISFFRQTEEQILYKYEIFFRRIDLAIRAQQQFINLNIDQKQQFYSLFINSVCQNWSTQQNVKSSQIHINSSHVEILLKLCQNNTDHSQINRFRCLILHALTFQLERKQLQQKYELIYQVINQDLIQLDQINLDDLINNYNFNNTCLIHLLLRYNGLQQNSSIQNTIFSLLYKLMKNDVLIQRICLNQLGSQEAEQVIQLFTQDESLDKTKFSNQFIQQITTFMVYFKINDINIWKFFYTDKLADNLLLKYKNFSDNKNNEFIQMCCKQILTFSENEKLILQGDYIQQQQIGNNQDVRKNLLPLIAFIGHECEYQADENDSNNNIIQQTIQQHQNFKLTINQLKDEIMNLIHDTIASIAQENQYKIDIINQLIQIKQQHPKSEDTKCLICGTIQPDETRDMFKRFKTCCIICQLDLALDNIEMNNYIAERTALYQVLFANKQQKQLQFSNILIYPSKRTKIDYLYTHKYHPLMHYTKYNQSQQILAEVIYYDYLKPQTGLFCITEKFLTLQLQSVQSDTLNWLFRQVEPKYQVFKFNKQNVTIQNEMEINYGLYDQIAVTPSKQYIHIYFTNIRFIYKKKLANFYWVLEIILYNSQSHYLIFESQKDCDKLLYSNIFISQQIQMIPIDSTQNYFVKQLMKLCKSRQVSLYGILITINYMAGRSFSDLFQYPVFPFVHNQRDYSKVIGAQNDKILEKLLGKQQEFNETSQEKVSVFQTFFTHKAIASHYLYQLEPFLTIQRQLQNGALDHSDRQYQNLDKQWDKIFNGQSLTELVPEIFTTKQLFHEQQSSLAQQQQLIQLRQQLELNPGIIKWIELIFNNMVPLDCYPNYVSCQNEYISTSDINLIKTLFYGQQPIQLQQKFGGIEITQPELLFQITNRTYPKLVKQVKESKSLNPTPNQQDTPNNGDNTVLVTPYLSNASNLLNQNQNSQQSYYKLLVNYQLPTLPIPYYIHDYKYNEIIYEGQLLINDKILVVKNNIIYVNQIQKLQDYNELKQVQQAILITEFTFDYKINNIIEIGHNIYNNQHINNQEIFNIIIIFTNYQVAIVELNISAKQITHIQYLNIQYFNSNLYQINYCTQLQLLLICYRNYIQIFNLLDFQFNDQILLHGHFLQHKANILMQNCNNINYIDIDQFNGNIVVTLQYYNHYSQINSQFLIFDNLGEQIFQKTISIQNAEQTHKLLITKIIYYLDISKYLLLIFEKKIQLIEFGFFDNIIKEIDINETIIQASQVENRLFLVNQQQEILLIKLWNE